MLKSSIKYPENNNITNNGEDISVTSFLNIMCDVTDLFDAAQQL